MSSRPVLFLDIDGTIAPLRGEYDGDVSWAPAFLYDHPCKSLASVPYYPDLIERVQALHDSGLVEIRWLTSWPEHWCTRWQSAGLGPFAHNPVRYGTRRWWKAAVVKEWLDEHPDGRSVWTDDDLTPGRRLRGYGDRLLQIRPDSAVGLTHAHLDRIETRLRSWRDADA